MRGIKKKIKALLSLVNGSGKYGIMDTNMEGSCCREVEVVEYFELMGAKHSDKKKESLKEFRYGREIV